MARTDRQAAPKTKLDLGGVMLALAGVIGWVFAGPGLPNFDRIRAERQAAADAFVDARKRGDTRRQHDAAETARRLATQALRMELGR